MPHLEPLGKPGWFARFVAWVARRRFGRVPAPLPVYAHSSPILAAVGCYELAAERAHAAPAELKALINLKVAALVGCPFCLDIGSALAQNEGVTAQQVTELRAYRTSLAFTARHKLALDLAVHMTQTPVRMPAELMVALQRELGTTATFELCAAAAWENYRARLNHALGITEQGFSDGAVCALAEGALG